MKILLPVAAAATLLSAPAFAQITPGNRTITDLTSPVPVGTSFGVLPGENTNGGSAQITAQSVSDADGSLNITGDRSRVQTGIQYSPFTTNSGVLANSIQSLTADYFINSLGANLSATPALRVLIQDGSTRSELIYEGANNGMTGLGAGSVSADALFYQFVAGCGATFVNPNCGGSGTYVLRTLADFGETYSASAFVSGLSIGVGSGAGTGFSANVDNLAFTTDAGTARYNFATAAVAAVPEPSTWAMMLVGFGGIGAAMRRSRRRENNFLSQLA